MSCRRSWKRSGALVVVLDPSGRIVRFNRACEQTTGYSFAEVKGERVWDLFLAREDRERFQAGFDQLLSGSPPKEEESYWLTREWRPAADSLVHHDPAGPRPSGPLRHRLRDRYHRAQTTGAHHPGDQRPGTAPHWSGSARWPGAASHRHRIHEQGAGAEAGGEIAAGSRRRREDCGLVNEAIHKTRELARGLLPVQSDAQGLMSALQQFASRSGRPFSSFAAGSNVKSRYWCRMKPSPIICTASHRRLCTMPSNTGRPGTS